MDNSGWLNPCSTGARYLLYYRAKLIQSFLKDCEENSEVNVAGGGTI